MENIDFLRSKTSKQWASIGTHRRAGVLAPLFSLHSQSSIGIGEYPDIKLLADWCNRTSMSIIQLLPLNDIGFDFAPYSGQSTFALEPMYLALERLCGVEYSRFASDIMKVREMYGKFGRRVDYTIKGAKLKVLHKIYGATPSFPQDFDAFKKQNRFWLDDYAAFKVMKDKFEQKAWEEWPEEYKYRESGELSRFAMKNSGAIDFQKWMQWQIYTQFKDAKACANLKGVFIQGDLPFLVSRDSADVWSHQNYFKLDLSSGAPPDMYFAMGQRWGMPPYNWETIESHKYDYLAEKVKYAENFYDMFRIDHFVGLFRLWTIKGDEPASTYGLNGAFDPADESLWKEHGQKILNAMTQNTTMLPCAEDLGVVPACSYETLKEYGIPGMDVQRWTRDWGNTYDFKPSDSYRENSIAIISSHDMSPLIMWWEQEASTVDAMLVEKLCDEYDYDLKQVQAHLFDMNRSTKQRLRWHQDIHTPEEVLRRLGKTRDRAWMFYDMHRESYDEAKKFWEYIGMQGTVEQDASPAFVEAAIKKCSSARSIFAIQLMQDWLSLGKHYEDREHHEVRVNTPGTIGAHNWTSMLPVSLEELQGLEINTIIKGINEGYGRK
ncbi:MAG: 4-alpha-glucanotransferase [Spirochaetia bacterium]|nr:4-alpha-glucanotransferase [Spirochaetia bacterium]